MPFASIIGALTGGFAMRIYAGGFAIWLATEVVHVVVPVLHAASNALGTH